MELLALGISLICLLYIFLLYVLLSWFNHLGNDEEVSKQLSGIKRLIKSKIRKLITLRIKEDTRETAK